MTIEKLFQALSEAIEANTKARLDEIALERELIDLKKQELAELSALPESGSAPPDAKPARTAPQFDKTQAETAANLNKPKSAASAADNTNAVSAKKPDPVSSKHKDSLEKAADSCAQSGKKIEPATADDLRRIDAAVSSYLTVVAYDKKKVAEALKDFGYKNVNEIKHDEVTEFIDHIQQLARTAQAAAADDGWE